MSVVVFYFYLLFSHTFTLHPNRSLPHLLSSERPPHLPFRKELTSQGFEANTHSKLQKTRHNLLYHGHTVLTTLNLICLGILISLFLTTEKRVYIYLLHIWAQILKIVVGMLMSLTNMTSQKKVKRNILSIPPSH